MPVDRDRVLPEMIAFARKHNRGYPKDEPIGLVEILHALKMEFGTPTPFHDLILWQWDNEVDDINVQSDDCLFFIGEAMSCNFRCNIPKSRRRHPKGNRYTRF